MPGPGVIRFDQTTPQSTAKWSGLLWWKCDVHAWMSGFVGVSRNRYFAVSDAAGAFRIENLPPGHYSLTAWHKKFGEKTLEVSVEPGQAAKFVIRYGQKLAEGATCAHPRTTLTTRRTRIAIPRESIVACKGAGGAKMMTLRSKATAWAFATAIGVRFLFWLGGVLLGWREANAWEVAFAIGAMVAFFIVIDEVDAVRSVYAQELAKLRVEANRDAVAWAEGNGETQSLGMACMEGWNKNLHARTSTTMPRQQRSWRLACANGNQWRT